ncbi:MAG: hypothetical protein ACJA1C_000789 [Crocinitomicaceae bacterium]|jgi:hypothetical protein
MDELIKSIHTALFEMKEADESANVNRESPPSKFFEQTKTDVTSRLNARLKSSECSDLLINQLTIHLSQVGEKFGNQTYCFHAPSIIDMLECLELKKCLGDPFKHPPLKGILHAHHGSYTNKQTVIRNVYEYWFNSKNQVHRHQKNELYDIIRQIPSQKLGAILISMHTRAMGNRAQENKLKGEWVIYKEYNHKMYFLCLATHKEGDKAIFNNKIKMCMNEFPQIF